MPSRAIVALDVRTSPSPTQTSQRQKNTRLFPSSRRRAKETFIAFWQLGHSTVPIVSYILTSLGSDGLVDGAVLRLVQLVDGVAADTQEQDVVLLAVAARDVRQHQVALVVLVRAVVVRHHGAAVQAVVEQH